MQTKGEKTFQVFNTILMSLLMFMTLYPFLYVIFGSLSDPWQLLSYRGALWRPLGFSLEAYKAVMTNNAILNGYKTTLFNLFVGTTVNIVLTLFGAYAISRKGFLFRKPITIFILFTMFFSSGVIPRFLVVQKLGMFDTYMSMILPTAINVFNLVIMRTAMDALPDSLEEAAIIEGANDIDVLFRIVCPLIKSTIAVLVLYYGVAHWNQWYQSLLYVQNRSKFPLQMVLREILIGNSYDSMTTGLDSSAAGAPIAVTIKYATIMVSTIPILAIYPLLQKYFVKGVMVGAVKG